jgi:putative flippase GtrA
MMFALARGEGTIAPDSSAGCVPVSRLRPGRAGQLLHFAGVGAVSTVTFAVLFCLLYRPVGAIGADVLALLLCAVGNLAANRRFTFADRGRPERRAYYARGLMLSLLPLATTLAALAGTALAGVGGLGADLAAITVANLSASAARFHFLARAAAPGRGTGQAVAMAMTGSLGATPAASPQAGAPPKGTTAPSASTM